MDKSGSLSARSTLVLTPSFNPSFSMDKSGSFCGSTHTLITKCVSILVFQWISLEDTLSSWRMIAQNVSILVFQWISLEEFNYNIMDLRKLCFNPSFSMDKSGSKNEL